MLFTKLKDCSRSQTVTYAINISETVQERDLDSADY